MQDKRLDINKDLISNLKNYLKIYTDDALAKELNVSPSAVAQWYKRGIPQRFIIEYKEIISGAGEEKVRVKNEKIHIQSKEQKDMELQANYVIELQKDKIKQQAKEIEILQSYLNNHPIEKIQWNDIDPDMESIVLVRNVLSFKKMERKMTIDKSGVKLEKLLGLPKGHNYFDDSKWYPMDKHPIDEIIDNKSLEELKKISNTLPSLFESFKFIVGDHYMSFPIIYKYKDRRVITQCSIMLEWKSSPKKILTKTVFINPEVN
tara:strand:+ start:924 stop:1709 length:786 start_codon:yes stop_codon:yes gene_type:complete